jgi:hypothetical protein
MQPPRELGAHICAESQTLLLKIGRSKSKDRRKANVITRSPWHDASGSPLAKWAWRNGPWSSRRGDTDKAGDPSAKRFDIHASASVVSRWDSGRFLAAGY